MVRLQAAAHSREKQLEARLRQLEARLVQLESAANAQDVQRNIRELESVFSDAAAQPSAELPVPAFLMPQPLATTAAEEDNQPGKDATMQVVPVISNRLVHEDVLRIRAGSQ